MYLNLVLLIKTQITPTLIIISIVILIIITINIIITIIINFIMVISASIAVLSDNSFPRIF